MKLTVLGSRELVSGFRLAGIDGIETTPSPEGRELFAKAVSDRNVAIVLVGLKLYRYLKKDIDAVRENGPIPAIVGLPERSDPMEPPQAAAFLEAIGLGVHTDKGR